MIKPFIFSSLVLATLAGCNETPGTPGTPASPETPAIASNYAPVISYSIVARHPHDTAYFTEGLEFHENQLFESSGGNMDSSPYPSAFGIVDRKTGKVTTKVSIDKSKYFGEGITFFNGKLYQLTWTSKTGFVYDAKTFKQLKTFEIPSQQGWGLTHDSTHLIMSDGSNTLLFLNPETLQVAYTVSVTDNSEPIGNINELEYVDGYIYANRWQTPFILKIEAKTGKVVGKLDLTALINEIYPNGEDEFELNGIARDPQTGNFLVTGKKWPTAFEIKF
ncbi:MULTISPECIES: glutaminyl-peptide cyclotransferase [unclassified Paraflavitalea]|uniref:glutaminyl-peptide cyclotransferase n=1 Tax=unclassified Paraflavitalea TaxID=2798305 RepID=UPI003D350CFA